MALHEHTYEVRVERCYVGSDSEPTYIAHWEPDTGDEDAEDGYGMDEQEERFTTLAPALARTKYLLRRRPECCSEDES